MFQLGFANFMVAELVVDDWRRLGRRLGRGSIKNT
jgi:hypothetical protein